MHDGSERFISRSLFIDSEFSAIENLLANSDRGLDISHLYTSDSFITGSGRAMSTFAEGIATSGGQFYNQNRYNGNNFHVGAGT